MVLDSPPRRGGSNEYPQSMFLSRNKKNNVYPCKPQFCYINIFHISALNIDCGYSIEPPRRGGSNEYPQSMFLSRNKKNNVYPCKPQFYYINIFHISAQNIDCGYSILDEAVLTSTHNLCF